jgi:two-component system response regulator ResD
MTDPKRQYSIVIAEDDMFLQKILATKFAKEGFDVRVASDGEEALGVIRKKAPDIVLMDLILPKMRTDPAVRDVPVVVLTNLGQDEDKQRAFDLGALKFMIKSDLSINEVVASVKEAFAKRIQSKR